MRNLLLRTSLWLRSILLRSILRQQVVLRFEEEKVLWPAVEAFRRIEEQL
ncbi:hypothetical protein [Rosistilla ulvae]|nr:hypothetical protein [Rosistilla ulvae]